MDIFFTIMPNWMIFSFIAILALIFGSFLNVVIYRLPLIINNHDMSLSLPRSFCPNCHNTIAWFYNIPIVSYLYLKGRCVYCNNKISPQYILVEILTLILSLATIIYFGMTIKALFIVLFCYIVIPLGFIDYKQQILPDSLTLTLVWIGLLASTQQIFTTPTDAIIGTIVGYLALKLFIAGYKMITGKIGMGGGDIKLFAAFGAWFGWQSLAKTLFFASCIGLIVGGTYLLISKQSKNTRIAFGPFLIVAASLNFFDNLLNLIC